jgi:hypothetical protein
MSSSTKPKLIVRTPPPQAAIPGYYPARIAASIMDVMLVGTGLLCCITLLVMVYVLG